MIYGGRYKKMATVRHIIEVFGEGFYPDMSDGRQECKNSRVLSRQSQAVLLVREQRGWSDDARLITVNRQFQTSPLIARVAAGES